MNWKNLWKIHILAVWAICFLPFAAFAQPPTAGSIIDLILEAYGGREALLDVRVYRLDGVLHAHVRKQNAQVVRVIRMPHGLELMIRYPSQMEVRRSDGKGVWRGASPHTMAPVQGPMRGAVVLQAARSHLPWVLHELRGRARLSRAADGLYVLEIPVEDELRLIAFVDPATRRIVRSESVVKVGKREIRFQTRYTDFRKVEKVLFPFREDTFVSGVHTGTIAVQRIWVNPPKEGQELPIPPGHPRRRGQPLKFS